uniref:Uncharacterized protein n=1 Tax=Anguilla anguilla TaxID=7936 RepID=A0A0E9PBR6_ANGAN
MSMGMFLCFNVEIIIEKTADSRYPVPFTHHGNISTKNKDTIIKPFTHLFFIKYCR